MPRTCPYCKENCVEEDGNYIQEHLICTACGAVIEEGKLTASTEGTVYAFQDQNVSIKTKVGFGLVSGRVGCKTISEGLKQGLKVIDVLVSKFRVPSTLAEETRDLFRKVIRTPTIKYKKLHTKCMIAACCVYIVLRQSDWPISLLNICQAYRCLKDDLSSAFSLVIRATNIKMKQAPIEEVVESNLADLAFDPGERQAVVRRTQEIIHLAGKLWITSGRTSRPLVVGASFLAWKSMNLERNKVTYPKFCRQMKVDSAKVFSHRVVEITSMLIKLGSGIPWLEKESLIPRNISVHLADILRYSNTLRVVEQETERSGEENVDEFQKFRFPGKRQRKRGIAEETPEGSPEITDEDINQYIRTQEEVDVITQLYQRYEKDLEVASTS